MRRRFWYSASSVAADKPDKLSFASKSAEGSSLTLPYAAGDLGYAVRKTEDSLLDKACSSLMASHV
jgi:hypothetical protein